MNIRELNQLFAKRLPKGRQRSEIRAAAEIRLAAKSLALIVLKNLPKESRDSAVLNLRDYLAGVYAVIDLDPFRVRQGN